MQRLTVGLVGHYQPDYSRNRVLKAALALSGSTVVEAACSGPFVARARTVLEAARELSEVCDCLIVPFPGHADVPIVRLAARIPVLFDPFISLYETIVEDRRRVPVWSCRAIGLWAEDAIALHSAHHVLFDTWAHAHWASRMFRFPRSRCHRVFLGADEEMMKRSPLPPREDHLDVLFYGSYSPLQGADVIIRAAEIVGSWRKDVRFTLIGDGQDAEDVRRLARTLEVDNVRFLPRISKVRLAEEIARSHVCLGIFGTSGKASRVIPNKVFDAASVGRVIITADTPAVREAFVTQEEIIVVPTGDPRGLAMAIKELADSEALCQNLASAGGHRFDASLSNVAVSAQLVRAMSAAMR